MPFWKQVREAIRCQIEDFFHVPWELVVLMVIVVAGLVDYAYVRLTDSLLQRPPFWSVRTLLPLLSLSILFLLRRLRK